MRNQTVGWTAAKTATLTSAVMDDIKSNQLSCVSSGCHDMAHNVAHLNNVKYWSPQP